MPFYTKLASYNFYILFPDRGLKTKTYTIKETKWKQMRKEPSVSRLWLVYIIPTIFILCSYNRTMWCYGQRNRVEIRRNYYIIVNTTKNLCFIFKEVFSNFGVSFFSFSHTISKCISVKFFIWGITLNEGIFKLCVNSVTSGKE